MWADREGSGTKPLRPSTLVRRAVARPLVEGRAWGRGGLPHANNKGKRLVVQIHFRKGGTKRQEASNKKRGGRDLEDPALLARGQIVSLVLRTRRRRLTETSSWLESIKMRGPPKTHHLEPFPISHNRPYVPVLSPQPDLERDSFRSFVRKKGGAVSYQQNPPL